LFAFLPDKRETTYRSLLAAEQRVFLWSPEFQKDEFEAAPLKAINKAV